MDQPQGALTPYASARHFLGAELRRWRNTRQLSVAELARQVYVSRELLQKVETAQRRASADLVHACDTALDTGGILGRLLNFITHTERAPAPAPPPLPTVLIRITAEVIPAETPSARSTVLAGGDGLAKVLQSTQRHRPVAVIVDSQVLNTIDIPGGETCVEIPDRLVPFFQRR